MVLVAISAIGASTACCRVVSFVNTTFPYQSAVISCGLKLLVRAITLHFLVAFVQPAASSDAASNQSLEREASVYPCNANIACALACVIPAWLAAGTKTHTTVQQALEALQHLDHRGATSADALTGDGVGVLTQVRQLVTAGWRMPCILVACAHAMHQAEWKARLG